MKADAGIFKRILVLIALAIGSQQATAQIQLSTIPDNCKDFNKAVDAEPRLDQRRKEQLKSSSSLLHTLIWENDSFAAGGDYNYTNGMKLTWLHNPCQHTSGLFNWTSMKSHYKDALANLRGQSPADFVVHSSGVFGMNMYTPNDLYATAPITTDRPYAGWIYGGFNLQATRELPSSGNADEEARPMQLEVHQLELQVGITGPKSLQREAQNYIHRNITDSPLGQGWDYQIPGRLGFNALYMVRREFSPSTSWRVVPHAGFSVGNLVQFVNAGGMVLFGNSNGEYPGTTSQPAAVPANPGKHIFRKRQGESEEEFVERRLDALVPGPVLYGFAGIDARYVFNSVFVEGFDKNANDIDLIHGVYDLMAGLAWGGRNYRLSYKIIWRSKEFQSPDPRYEKSHRIGQFGLTWYF